jgi:hypothetical protein
MPNTCGYCELNFRVLSKALYDHEGERQMPFCWRCANDLIVIFEADQRAAERKEWMEELKNERSA